MPKLYIIGGCNGAGKTTASYTMLPEMLNCKEFVNADSIASGISPFQPESVAFKAGRLMLKRINRLIKNKADFGIETTLSTRSYAQKIKECKKLGYEVILVFFWLYSPELAIQRVKERVKKGGHSVPENVIRRRYKRGLKNLFSKFMSLSDYWLVIDNSQTNPLIVSEGIETEVKFVYNKKIWSHIISLK